LQKLLDMEFTARKIADILKGTVIGDDNVMVSRISKIEEGEKGSITFFANPKYTNYLYSTRASIVLVDNNFVSEYPLQPTLIKVENPYVALAILMEFYNNVKDNQGISELCFVAKNAKTADNVFIGAFTYISENVVIEKNVKIYPQVFVADNVEIKENTIIYPGVKIYSDTKIGKNCIIHAGTVIGSDGFGFAPDSNNNYVKIPQIGNVVIEDDVEIGANVTIDRATIGSTIIRRGVKLDNLIQVAHNVEIGENTVIAAQSGISGSTKLGKNMMVGGQVGFAGHLKVADGVKIGAQSGINSNVNQENEVLFGSPAFKLSEYKRSAAIFKNLPELRKQVLDLENQVRELKKIIENK